MVAVGQIFLNPRFEAAASLALRDMHKIVQKQLAVAPSIGADDDGMAEAHAPGIVADYSRAPRRFGQLLVIGQRNPIDDQDSDPRTILNTG